MRLWLIIKIIRRQRRLIYLLRVAAQDWQAIGFRNETKWYEACGDIGRLGRALNEAWDELDGCGAHREWKRPAINANEFLKAGGGHT